MNDKKILIFGGNKFLGLHLIDKLLQRFEAKNIYSLTRSGNTPHQINSLRADRKDINALKAELGEKEFDLVFDLSAYQLADLEPSFNLLKNKVKSWVLVSSAGVYAPSDILPFQINFPKTQNQPHLGKLECEEFLRQNTKTIHTFCLRPFYIYGSYNSFDRETFLFRALQEEKTILIPNNGLALLQFIHVSELARLMVELALLPSHQTQEGIFNIGDKNLYSLNSLVNICADIIGKKPKIKNFSNEDCLKANISAREVFPLRGEHYFGDLSELNKLGLQTQIDLANGLEQTYRWFKQNSNLYPNYSITPAGQKL